jgi:hypothetical protein
MNLSSLPEYKNLEKELDRCVKLNINFLIVTFVGYSVTFYLKKILDKKNKNITYVNQDNQNLSRYNILDLDFCNNENALEIVEKYLRSANLDQKFAVVINTPQILDTNEFKKSYIGTHFYSIYKFIKPNLEASKVYTEVMGLKLSEEKINRLYELTGGIGRLGKYLLSNPQLIDHTAETLAADENIVKLINPIIDTYSKSTNTLLEEYGIKKDGHFTSEIIDKYIEKHPSEKVLEISVSPDLMLIENNTESNKLNSVEARIIKYIISDKGLIEKEKIAEIKWGEGSYDKYSDQAIVKTIRRLNKKMKFYKFATISKVGYKLEEK